MEDSHSQSSGEALQAKTDAAMALLEQQDNDLNEQLSQNFRTTPAKNGMSGAQETHVT